MKILKDKRGLAIELAMIVLFIVVAVFIVLITVSQYVRQHGEDGVKNAQTKASLDRIADEYLLSPTEFDKNDEKYDGYEITIEEGVFTVMQTKTGKKLTVSSAEGKIAEWRYE